MFVHYHHLLFNICTEFCCSLLTLPITIITSNQILLKLPLPSALIYLPIILLLPLMFRQVPLVQKCENWLFLPLAIIIQGRSQCSGDRQVVHEYLEIMGFQKCNLCRQVPISTFIYHSFHLSSPTSLRCAPASPSRSHNYVVSKNYAQKI